MGWLEGENEIYRNSEICKLLRVVGSTCYMFFLSLSSVLAGSVHVRKID